MPTHSEFLTSIWAPRGASNPGCQQGWCNINYASLQMSARCISITMGGDTEAYQGQSGLKCWRRLALTVGMHC